MIRSIYVINETGICLFHEDFSTGSTNGVPESPTPQQEKSEDHQLVAGFFSAILNFARMNTGQTIESFALGEEEYFFLKAAPLYFILKYQHGPDFTLTLDQVLPLLERLRDEFTEQFPTVAQEVVITVDEFTSFCKSAREIVSRFLKQTLKYRLMEKTADTSAFSAFTIEPTPEV